MYLKKAAHTEVISSNKQCDQLPVIVKVHALDSLPAKAHAGNLLLVTHSVITYLFYKVLSLTWYVTEMRELIIIITDAIFTIANYNTANIYITRTRLHQHYCNSTWTARD